MTRAISARVERLVRYPVKGMSGQDVADAEIRPGSGIPYDRVLALADGLHGMPQGGQWAATETFARLTTHSGLLGVGIALDEQSRTVTLTRPPVADATSGAGPADVTVTLDDTTSRERATAALREWFPGEIDASAALVQADNAYWDERDGTVSLINLDSVDALSAAAGEAVDPLRFRGNIYLSGLGAWTEFALVGERISVGGAELEILRPMSRCRATCVSPSTSRVDTNVPAELTTRFGHIYCGLRARVVTAGTVRTGDSVAHRGAGSGPEQGASRPDPAQWPRPARIVARHEESEEVTSLWLRDPQHGTGAKPLPGQHLRIHAADGSGPVWRCYTLSGVDGGDLRISVQRAADGRMSGLLHDVAVVGEELLVSGPHGHVTLDPGATGPLVLASAGIGITQTLAMLRACAAEQTAREVLLCHTARDTQSLALWHEAYELIGKLPHGRAELFLTRASLGERERWGARAGRPDFAALDLPGGLGEAEAYLCGPVEFMRDARAGLAGRGVPDSAVHQEVFVSPGSGAGTSAPPEPGPFRVSFAGSGVSAVWDANSGTLLDLAESAGVQARSACRSGACLQCEQPLNAGKVAYTTAPMLPPPDDSVLLCCAVPVGDVTLPL
ncbi:Flavohemoprotein [Streptomyces sp. YIM 130001]|uniref:MOSC domain-containing protein n=1 Tax=Streptomyces sp. YIM 130001 TaxID=2259644 RepID=UPI000E64F873|nr:MOSC domain-containing protein [Streptomyces sp. YIM 130001]RII08643.1 Flavohemoprotein [Streptomyces sp. YIM 130001]